jgi:hypothetical protein
VLRLIEPSERQVAVVRVALGAYLLVHFAALIPHAEEVFGSVGMLPDALQLPSAGLFPNVLAADNPKLAPWLLLAGCSGSLLFALGILRRSLALGLWLLWASLLNRNPFIANPSIPYVGWLLLAFAVIPVESIWRIRLQPQNTAWSMPPGLSWVAWLLLGLGYTLSGVDKLASPSWVDGSALSHVLSLPLARDTPLRDLLLLLPRGLLRGLTWTALALEISALPLFLLPQLRAWAWLALTTMQLALLSVLDFADLTVGMLVFHAFVFERGSLPRRPEAPPTPKQSPRIPGFSPGGAAF